MADRRRVNAPAAGTKPPVFCDAPQPSSALERKRKANVARGIFLQTRLAPSASGSAYLELESPCGGGNGSEHGLKVVCTVHGPRSLPRSAPFSPQLVLSSYVKFAPFATRERRGYLRDALERDLSVNLDTALRGVVIAERWPKSGVDIIVTIIEGDLERRAQPGKEADEWDKMNVLSGCITAASAALADAGIDCVDIVSGGVAAFVEGPGDQPSIVVDPVVSEHGQILAACCVAYLPARDEITSLWLKGQLPASDPFAYTRLVSRAVLAAKGANNVIAESLIKTMEQPS